MTAHDEPYCLALIEKQNGRQIVRNDAHVAMKTTRANGPSCRILVSSFPRISGTCANLDSASPLRVACAVLLSKFREQIATLP